MAGNSWQQPVAGEPSRGTLHNVTGYVIKVVDAFDPTTTATVVTDLSSYVPAGCSAVALRTSVVSATAGRNLWIRDPSDLQTSHGCTNETAGGTGRGDGIGYLDSSLNLRWKVDNSDVSSVTIWLTGYYI